MLILTCSSSPLPPVCGFQLGCRSLRELCSGAFSARLAPIRLSERHEPPFCALQAFLGLFWACARLRRPWAPGPSFLAPAHSSEGRANTEGTSGAGLGAGACLCRVTLAHVASLLGEAARTQPRLPRLPGISPPAGNVLLRSKHPFLPKTGKANYSSGRTPRGRMRWVLISLRLQVRFGDVPRVTGQEVVGRALGVRSGSGPQAGHRCLLFVPGTALCSPSWRVRGRCPHPTVCPWADPSGPGGGPGGPRPSMCLFLFFLLPSVALSSFPPFTCVQCWRLCVGKVAVRRV